MLKDVVMISHIITTSARRGEVYGGGAEKVFIDIINYFSDKKR